MGDEEVQSAMDVIEDKRDAARDAFEDLCMTVDRMIEEKADLCMMVDRMNEEKAELCMTLDRMNEEKEDLCMTMDRMNEEKAEKQEEARARWEHQSARGSWSRDRVLTSDWSGSSI